MSGEQQLATGSREGYVELSVHDTTVFVETVGREEVELIALLNGERIDDDVALRPLIALHGVDRDIVQQGYPIFVNGLANGGNLIPVRHNHANGLVDVEAT